MLLVDVPPVSAFAIATFGIGNFALGFTGRGFGGATTASSSMLLAVGVLATFCSSAAMESEQVNSIASIRFSIDFDRGETIHTQWHSNACACL